MWYCAPGTSRPSAALAALGPPGRTGCDVLVVTATTARAGGGVLLPRSGAPPGHGVRARPPRVRARGRHGRRHVRRPGVGRTAGSALELQAAHIQAQAAVVRRPSLEAEHDTPASVPGADAGPGFKPEVVGKGEVQAPVSFGALGPDVGGERRAQQAAAAQVAGVGGGEAALGGVGGGKPAVAGDGAVGVFQQQPLALVLGHHPSAIGHHKPAATQVDPAGAGVGPAAHDERLDGVDRKRRRAVCTAPPRHRRVQVQPPRAAGGRTGVHILRLAGKAGPGHGAQLQAGLDVSAPAAEGLGRRPHAHAGATELGVQVRDA